ncbi:extracellular solute-binding protein [Agromyces sp. Soil535]|uniref:extracellular solute-binding protein n=1 Tax=Agromyces sp. Soil535 TaxID=1736390 RepID=UPI0006F62404|nr:extracellular solute-binding protein [Agromyces sp. Soil535]KRE22972.1 hypothetical protein ASG80_08880 [Agromyces sp. Soil535]
MTTTARRLRRVLAVGVSLVAAGSLVACAGTAEETSAASELSGEVVFADYGGPTHDARQAAFFDGFSAETGVEVASATLEDALLFEMLEGGEGDYDLVQASGDYVVSYSDNMIELPDTVDNDLMPEVGQPYAAGGFVFGIAQAWLTETFPDGGPQTWADFFDTEKFPGKRAWPGVAGSVDASYEIALLADGVAPEDLYPLDIERAQAKLDTIKDDLVFYTSYAETQTLLTSGSAAIAVSVTGQYQSLINQGLDVTIQWNQAFPSASYFVIPTGAPNPENAIALAEWMSEPENQIAFVEKTGYGPSNSATFDLLSDEVKANVPNSEEHLAISVTRDEEYIAAHREELYSSYGEWLAE